MEDTMRNIALGAYVGAVLFTLAFSWVWISAPKQRAKLVRSFGSRHRLVLDPSMGPLAERLLVAQRRGRCLAGLAGLTAVTLPLILVPVSGTNASLGTLTMLLLFMPILWLQALGGAIGVGMVARPAPDAPRVARLSEPRLDDYLPPRLRWWGPVSLAIAGMVTAAYVASPPTGDGYLGRGGAAVGLGFAAFAIVVDEITIRGLLRVPQPASTATELALRDTIRGEALVELALGVVPWALAGILLMERLPPDVFPLLFVVVIGPPLVLHRDQRHRLQADLWRALPPPTGEPPAMQ